jgi:hypothetical protein
MKNVIKLLLCCCCFGYKSWSLEPGTEPRLILGLESRSRPKKPIHTAVSVESSEAPAPHEQIQEVMKLALFMSAFLAVLSSSQQNKSGRQTLYAGA